jgi:hypothetical protein
MGEVLGIGILTQSPKVSNLNMKMWDWINFGRVGLRPSGFRL